MRSGLAWVEALCWIAGASPRIGHALRGPAVWGAWRAPELRERLLCNAVNILGPTSTPAQRTALARAVLGNFHRFLVDLSAGRRLAVETIADRARDVQGIEHYLQAKRGGRGVIVATAHMGDFETGIAALGAIEPNIFVVFKRDELPAFERLRSAQRERLGVVEAPIDDGLKTWLLLREALRANATVLMQADRAMPGQGGMPVKFLHAHLLAPVGPAKLSLVTGAPIVPVFSLRTGSDAVRIAIEPMIVPGDGPGGGLNRAAIESATVQLVGVIERYVARYPDQWLTLHNPWAAQAPSE
ncbi:lysophospholipid acyltransferase family protein [Roseiflexus sp. AH-315-K22]|nr:lysophospholipid acyltransferase family protein [Roseiflexus sp. AH-315-K22]